MNALLRAFQAEVEGSETFPNRSKLEWLGFAPTATGAGGISPQTVSGALTLPVVMEDGKRSFDRFHDFLNTSRHPR